MEDDSEWQRRVSAVWDAADDLPEADLVTTIDALVAERSADDAHALFEAASARDFAGREAEAEPLYRRALESGLDDELAARATIQLASTLRNLGRAEESVEVLEALLHAHPDDEWSAPAAAFLALALVSRGDERAAVAVALTALADLLPVYGRSIRSYAAELTGDDDA